MTANSQFLAGRALASCQTYSFRAFLPAWKPAWTIESVDLPAILQKETGVE